MAGLADIPFVGAYVQRQKMNEERPATELAQYGAARKIAMDEAMRQKLAGVTDPEARASIAAEFAGPEALMADATRRATNKQNNELALARLQQTAKVAEQNFAIRWQNARTAQERLSVEKDWKQWRSMAEAEELKYNIGSTVRALQWTPMPSDAAPAGPTVSQQDGKVSIQSSTPAADINLQGMDPASLARHAQRDPLFAKALQEAGVALPAAQATPAPAAPVAPPAGASAAPAEAPAAASPAPADAANLDARDIMARAAGTAGAPAVAQTAPGPAPAAPVAPQMPQFVGSPKEQAAARNKWLLQQSKASTAAAGDLTKTGEEYLKSLHPMDQELVKKIAAYEIDPKTLSVLGGRRERVLSMVARFDPKFDQKEYNTQYNAINRFATGQKGDTVRSLNVAIEHMDTARRMADALRNNNIPAFNWAANEYARQTGGNAPTNFEAVKNILADEVVKGVLGGQNALQDRQEMASKIRASSSPQQLHGALDTWTELLGGQLKGLEQQYTGATGRSSDDFRKRYMTPRGRHALETAIRASESKGASGGDVRSMSNEELLKRLTGGATGR